jgi:hypothetical protein
MPILALASLVVFALIAVVALKVIARVLPAALLAGVGALVAGLAGFDPVIAWAVLLIPALLLTARRRAGVRSRRRPAREVVIDAVPAAAPSPAPVAVGDPALWERLAAAGGWSARRRLGEARARCEGYLAYAARAPEEDLAELPVLVRRRVPELIGTCLDHLAHATPAERRALVADALASIEQVAEAAWRRRGELKEQAETGFRVQRSHLAQRLAPDPLAPPA